MFSSLHRCIAGSSREPTYIWHWLTAGITFAPAAITFMWLALLPQPEQATAKPNSIWTPSYS